MTYGNIKNLKKEEFKHLCGVEIETFYQMVKLVINHEKFKNRIENLQYRGLLWKIFIENSKYLGFYQNDIEIGEKDFLVRFNLIAAIHKARTLFKLKL